MIRALQQTVPRASNAPGLWVLIVWRASKRCHSAREATRNSSALITAVNPEHSVKRHIQQLKKIRAATPWLTKGARGWSPGPGRSKGVVGACGAERCAVCITAWPALAREDGLGFFLQRLAGKSHMFKLGKCCRCCLGLVREMRNEFSLVWVLWFACWSLWLVAYLAELKNRVRYISEQVEKYRGESMKGLSGRCHVGRLDRRVGALKLMPCSSASGWGHEPHGTECASPGDAVSVALHLQPLHGWEPAQPGRTNWKGSTGNHFKGQGIYSLSCKETAE